MEMKTVEKNLQINSEHTFIEGHIRSEKQAKKTS